VSMFVCVSVCAYIQLMLQILKINNALAASIHTQLYTYIHNTYIHNTYTCMHAYQIMLQILNTNTSLAHTYIQIHEYQIMLQILNVDTSLASHREKTSESHHYQNACSPVPLARHISATSGTLMQCVRACECVQMFPWRCISIFSFRSIRTFTYKRKM
jgi:hypothetical protein